jgi:3D (Asp-Asp-Asp) domain-containing protein
MRYKILIIVLILIFIPFLKEVFSPTNAIVEHNFIENDLFLRSNQNSIVEKSPDTKTYVVTVTGYSSAIDETDDEPYITASGEFVKEGIVASNFLPIGTKIKIPSLFGNKVFEVKDRMNKRFYYRVDVWFPTKEEAQNFGVYYNVKIEILN